MQPSNNIDDDGSAPDVPLTVPAFARAWESSPQVVSVRRPSTLPDPDSYHEDIEPQAIFELEEEQKDGSIKTIFVIPHSCTRCRTIKQSCSRLQPACSRCRKAGLSCKVVQEGYQRLRGPKTSKPSLRKENTSEIRKHAKASGPREPATRRITSSARSLSQVSSSNSRLTLASGSKRPRSPNAGPDGVPPLKKTQDISRNKQIRRHSVATMKSLVGEDLEGLVRIVDPSAQVESVMESSCKRSALKWTFVNNSRGQDKKFSRAQESFPSTPANTRLPRVWTNSLGGLLMVFPQLAKTPVHFSWLQSEVPILLCTSDTQGHWINSTTLTIDLSWDFSCYDFELESVVRSDPGGSSQHNFCQLAANSQHSALSGEAEPSLRDTHFPVGNGRHAISAPLPTPSGRVTPTEGATRDEPGTRKFRAWDTSPIYDAVPNDSVSANHFVQRTHPRPPSPIKNPSSSHGLPSQDGPLTYRTFERIPINKPPEVETLLNSYLHFIPLLLWMSQESELVPSKVPPEYAYSCMGLFFISNLRHSMTQHNISTTTGVVQGRVCWSATLHWAPGGEEALFDYPPTPSLDVPSDSAPLDKTIDLSHAWWFDPTDRSLSADNATVYRPRDLRTQFFSFIPLDLLADFHPSEEFPRGWFCKSCGMINVQEFFRHQICQSSVCRFAHKCVPQGTADPLSSFRDSHQRSMLIRPTSHIPSIITSHHTTGDDGMQSWIYSLKNGVILCHVFTGNQEHLQADATALFERIQSEMLLRKEDTSSPYFIHTTKLPHPSDGSEATVLEGVSDCVHIAYSTLSNFVLRYREIDKPQFGEIRMQAWVNAGSKKGNVFHASKFPVVVHCLGVEVVLNLTPKGGYEGAATVTMTQPNGERIESPPTEPLAGPSRDAMAELAIGNPVSVIPRTECDGVHAAGVAESSSNTLLAGPGIKAASITETKQKHVRKKGKIVKDKSEASIPEISISLVHGDCVVLYGDDFECQIVRAGTTILVIGSS